MQERDFWNDYMNAYEDMIRHTATTHAPWYVVPADHKWFTRLVVAAAIVDAAGGPRPCLPEGRRREEERARGRPGRHCPVRGSGSGPGSEPDDR